MICEFDKVIELYRQQGMTVEELNPNLTETEISGFKDFVVYDLVRIVPPFGEKVNSTIVLCNRCKDPKALILEGWEDEKYYYRKYSCLNCNIEETIKTIK